MRQYDYSLLRQRIKAFGTAEFISGLRISRCRLDKLLEGGSEFKADEIIDAALLLGLRADEIGLYFFTPYRSHCDN